MNLFDLSGKVAIVTGGNGGIGLGMATGLASAGADVAVVGRNADKNAAAAEKLRSHGVRSIAVEADVTDEQAIQTMVGRVTSELGGIHILINNAGNSVRKRPEILTREEFEWVMETNLTSAFLCSKYCYPAMKEAGGGKVLNNGSMMSLFGSDFAAAYGASKGRDHAIDAEPGCLPGHPTTSRSIASCPAGSIPTLPAKRVSRCPAFTKRSWHARPSAAGAKPKIWPGLPYSFPVRRPIS